jgi:hypothetical protein
MVLAYGFFVVPPDTTRRINNSAAGFYITCSLKAA